MTPAEVATVLAQIGGSAAAEELVDVAGRHALDQAVSHGAVLRLARGRYCLPEVAVKRLIARSPCGGTPSEARCAGARHRSDQARRIGWRLLRYSWEDTMFDQGWINDTLTDACQAAPGQDK